MIKVTKEEWRGISKDYKGRIDGKRSCFGGCIKKNGGTSLLIEDEHFIIVKERKEVT